MNRSIKYIILTVLAVLSVFSCSREERGLLTARGEGLLSVDIGNAPDMTVITKTVEQEMIFRIEVINSEGVTVATVDDHTTLAGEPLSLRVGHYTVRASHGKDVDAAFDEPFYAGETEVDIVEGETATAAITCALDRVKVSVSVSDKVKEMFKLYSVAVSNGEGGNLTYAAETFNSAGYFRCPEDKTLDYVVNLQNIDDDVFVIEQSISGVQPKDYYTINLDLNPEVTSSSAAAIRLTVDKTLNEQRDTMDVNLNKPARPVLTETTGIDVSAPVRVSQGNINRIGLFNLTAAGGVQSIVLTHDIQALIDKGVPASVSLLEPDSYVKDAAAAAGMLWADFEIGATSVPGLLDIRTMLSNLEIGTYGMTLTVQDQYAQKVPIKLTLQVVPSTEVSVSGKVNAWAKKAIVTSVYNTESQPEGLAVQYRKKGESAWTQYSGEIDVQGTEFTVQLTGLEPGTKYEVMPYTANEQNEASIAEFTTEDAAQLPNFSFDNWYKDGKNWYANADMGDNYFWDSGNKGANTLSEVNPTSPEETFVVSGKAVRMESKYVILAFAGGNIYSGSFGSVSGLGASINFGRPYTSRPSALHGWYSYAPKAIDKVKAPYEDLKGTMDVGKIYVALTDWSSPFNVNTNTGTFFVPDEDPAVIAYGELEIPESSNGEYKEFTINLEYRDLERRPTHVLVVATASKYADYFTGGVGSVMYIDEFEFLFE